MIEKLKPVARYLSQRLNKAIHWNNSPRGELKWALGYLEKLLVDVDTDNEELILLILCGKDKIERKLRLPIRIGGQKGDRSYFEQKIQYGLLGRGVNKKWLADIERQYADDPNVKRFIDQCREKLLLKIKQALLEEGNIVWLKHLPRTLELKQLIDECRATIFAEVYFAETHPPVAPEPFLQYLGMHEIEASDLSSIDK